MPFHASPLSWDRLKLGRQLLCESEAALVGRMLQNGEEGRIFFWKAIWSDGQIVIGAVESCIDDDKTFRLDSVVLKT
jgi:hypothetical protein